MADLCRLCLNQEVKLYNIFTHNGKSCTSIPHYVLHFFSIEIKKSDKVSTKICQDCLDFIILCCQKQIQYRKNNRIIHSLYSRINNCHPSIYKLMREQKCIKLPKTILNKNIDARVDLSIRNECLNIKVNGDLTQLDNGSQEIIMSMDKVKLQQQEPGTKAMSGRRKVNAAPTNQSYCSRRISRLHDGSEEVIMCVDEVKLEPQEPGTKTISGIPMGDAAPTNQSYCSRRSSRLHDGSEQVIMCMDQVKLEQQEPEPEAISEHPTDRSYCASKSGRLYDGSEEVIMCVDKIKLEQQEPETVVDEALMDQSCCSRRRSKRPRMYGDPILYEEYENNPLSFIFDQNECGSIQEPQIATNKRPYGRRKSLCLTRKMGESPGKHSATLSRVRKANKTAASKLQAVACTTEIIKCAEDTWNSFYEKNYEQSVFLCYCSNLFDDIHSLQSHWLNCANKFNLPTGQARPL